jgi:hypothetical protein
MPLSANGDVPPSQPTETCSDWSGGESWLAATLRAASPKPVTAEVERNVLRRIILLFSFTAIYPVGSGREPQLSEVLPIL